MSDCNLENDCSEQDEKSLDLKKLINEIPPDNSLYDMSEILKAVSDPLRLKIIYLLKNDELCGCHIDSALEKPQSTISHHLTVLKKSKLINWRKKGKWTYFSLANSKLIEQIENVTGVERTNFSEDLCSCETEIKLVESLVGDENGCACGSFNAPDQSKIENPKKPKTEITDSLLKTLKKKSEKLGVVSIGYAKIPKDIFNNDNTLEYSNAIVLTYPIGREIVDEIPSEIAHELNDNLYEKFGNISYELSDILRKEGFASQVAHPKEALTDLSKLGQEAGLGYIGKSGLLISPELGPRLKVSAILTTAENLPFSEKNSHEWIKSYCKRCSKCIKKCPEDALSEKEDKLAKAELFDAKCIGCSLGCTYCIESCPFFENGYNWVKEKQMKLDAKLKEKGKL
ncbi:MAG: metalloregulator ArsR/SmtB family transcription factor [Methanobrevibacter sp.]|nr:metalloregulator ArsR/SmtB family transcription factor [Methanobrevibacter sp.]